MSYDIWIIATGALVGISCGMVGCFLLLRKMAMLADAISHTVLLGIVSAFLVSHSLSGISMLIGALIVGLLTAYFVQLLDQSGVQTDAAIGVVFTSLFALGVILISLFADQVHIDADHALMGEIAFVPWDTIMVFGYLIPKAVLLLSSVFMLNLFLILLFYKELKLCSFDAQMAIALGIPVMAIHYLLMGMVSLSTVASFDAVGAILVVAMLIAPGATAYLLTDKLNVMLMISGVVGLASAIGGYYIAYLLNVSIAGSMAMTAGILFSVTFLFSPTHGMVAKWLNQHKLKNHLEG
ncbi:metal ABC transporter permease [Bacillus sp. BGMRC 2118]|nr:metal ABC transporter permease [Bacillus sp. BGMRC 2118]